MRTRRRGPSCQHKVRERGSVEAAGGGLPTRRCKTGRLVEHPEHRRDRAAVHVGVDQQDGAAEVGELVGKGHRDRRPSGCAGRPPDGEHSPGARRAGGGRSPLRGLHDRRGRQAEVPARVARGAPGRVRPCRADRVEQHGSDDCGIGVVRHDVGDPGPAQLIAAGRVSARCDADRNHPRGSQQVDRRGVEPAQTRRHERRAALTGPRHREQIDEVDAPPDDPDRVRAGLERGQQALLPLRTIGGGQDVQLHRSAGAHSRRSDSGAAGVPGDRRAGEDAGPQLHVVKGQRGHHPLGELRRDADDHVLAAGPAAEFACVDAHGLDGDRREQHRRRAPAGGQPQLDPVAPRSTGAAAASSGTVIVVRAAGVPSAAAGTSSPAASGRDSCRPTTSASVRG